ncbi:DMT family transporter [Candidatus Gracilibacteria bacterium]|nr:DMT family transporter [Candidatus Gracilibacteria bacterium]
MGERVGGAASSLIVHVSGALLSALLLIVRGGEHIARWRELPWYMLGSGIFGLILYISLSQTVPRLGATAAVVCVIVGQLLTGAVLDHFGLLGVAQRPIDLWRIIGILVIFGGAYLLVRGRRTPDCGGLKPALYHFGLQILDCRLTRTSCGCARHQHQMRYVHIEMVSYYPLGLRAFASL